MSIQQSIHLHYKKVLSNKFYKVELLKLSDEQYLVNFSYGKSNDAGEAIGKFTTGTKTKMPVSLEEAQKIYDKLVSSKTKKGYKEIAKYTPKAKVQLAFDENERNARILEHLRLGVTDPEAQVKLNWDIKRVIWKVGVLELTEGLPYVVELYKRNDDEFYRYNCLWTMIRCAQTEEDKSTVLTQLKGVADLKNLGNKCSRLASLGLSLFSKGEEKEAWQKELYKELPPSCQNLIQEQKWTALEGFLKQKYDSSSNDHAITYVKLYYLGLLNPQVKTILLGLVKALRTRDKTFRTFRYLLKLAECCKDYALLGLITKKMETAQPKYNKRYIYRDLKKKQINGQLSLSGHTLDYFQKRGLATLKALAKAKDIDYVRFATAILLAHETQQESSYHYDQTRWNYNSTTKRYDRFITRYPKTSSNYLLYHILYKNHPNAIQSGDTTRWHYKEGIETLGGESTERYENLPELWDKLPYALVHLLMQAESAVVLDFALKTFQLSPAYEAMIQQFDSTMFLTILEKRHEGSVTFALKTILQEYPEKLMENQLYKKLLNSPYAEVRKGMLDWISYAIKPNQEFTEILTGLICEGDASSRFWLQKERQRLTELFTLEQKASIFNAVLKYTVENSKKIDQTKVNHFKQFLGEFAKEAVQTLELETLLSILKINNVYLEDWAVSLVEHNHHIHDSVEHIDVLLRHNNARLQQQGKLILDCMPLSFFEEQLTLFLKYTGAKKQSVSQLGYEICNRLVIQPNLLLQIGEYFVKQLLRKENREEQHRTILNFLVENCRAMFSYIERKMIFRLLNSDHSVANELAALLLRDYIEVQSLSMKSIVQFASHELIAVRNLAKQIFRENVARIKYEVEEAIGILDAKWDDSRNFAIQYFAQEFEAKDWSAETLVRICDSTRPDIQSLGRDLLLRSFKQDDAMLYLQRLSEHPSITIQMLAAQLLQEYAADRVDLQIELKDYFITALTQVNKGRVAKDAIVNFLYAEALKAEPSAQLFTEVLNFVSAAQTIRDKEVYIEKMRDLQQKYPHLENLLTITATAV